jgi:EAL and modified HD-GYP domain-containing signal transduction protein
MSTIPVFLARQPILDRKVQVVGYEILYRTAGFDSAVFQDGDAATASVAVNSTLDLGLERLVGERRAWINVTRSVLTQRLYRFLPSERVVLELLEDVDPDPAVIAALEDAKARGYSLALDDFVLGERDPRLVGLADVIKVDLPRVGEEGIERHAEALKRGRARLLAEKVESHEVFERCQRAGFDLFQGYFFARPQTFRGRRAPADRGVLMQLLARIQDPTADVDDIERLIAANVGLSFKLLRYVNSAAFGVSRQVESVRHAVMMLGMERVRTCVMMLLLAGLDDKPHELVVTALVRARYCEHLAAISGERDASKPFTVGLLSVLDAFLDRPMESLLREVALAPDLEAALLRREGHLGRVLDAAIACERADWDKLAACGFDADTLRRAYVQSIGMAAQDDVALR